MVFSWSGVALEIEEFNRGNMNSFHQQAEELIGEPILASASFVTPGHSLCGFGDTRFKAMGWRILNLFRDDSSNAPIPPSNEMKTSACPQ